MTDNDSYSSDLQRCQTNWTAEFKCLSGCRKKPRYWKSSICTVVLLYSVRYNKNKKDIAFGLKLKSTDKNACFVKNQLN